MAKAFKEYEKIWQESQYLPHCEEMQFMRAGILTDRWSIECLGEGEKKRRRGNLILNG